MFALHPKRGISIHSRAPAASFAGALQAGSAVWATQLVFGWHPLALQWTTGVPPVLFDPREYPLLHLRPVPHPQDLIFLALCWCALAALVLFFFYGGGGPIVVWLRLSPNGVHRDLPLWLERITEAQRVVPHAPGRCALECGESRPQRRKAAVDQRQPAHRVHVQGYFTRFETWVAERWRRRCRRGWFWVVFYGSRTYGNAGYLREQICMQMCPYARIQSALTDMNTMVIAHDTQRGEARGRGRASADPTALGPETALTAPLCVQSLPHGHRHPRRVAK